MNKDVYLIRNGSTDYQIEDRVARTELDKKQEKLVSGTNIKTINGESILGTGDIQVSGGAQAVDAYTKTETDNKLATKQDKLVSGESVKTINGQSIIGAGDIAVEGGVKSEDFQRLSSDFYSLNPQSLGYAECMQLEQKELPTFCGYPMLIVSDKAPDTAPDFIGQEYIDTKARKVYRAVNTADASDFVVLN